MTTRSGTIASSAILGMSSGDRSAFARVMKQPSPAKVWFDERDVTIALEGDLATSATSVLPALRAIWGGVITLDLSAVTRIDGSGLELLITIADLAADAGARVRYGRAVAPRGIPIDLRDPTPIAS